MIHAGLIGHWRLWSLAVLVAAAVIGCSKKEQKSSAAAPPSDAATPAAPAAAAAAEAAPVPVVNVQSIADTKAAMAAADAALRARQYDQAAKTLLLLQQQRQLSAQQALAVRDQMRQLQTDLAGAVGSGDPRAKAAADMLRAAAMHH